MKWAVTFAAPVQPWQRFKSLSVTGQYKGGEEVILLSQVELRLCSARQLVTDTAHTLLCGESGL